MLAYPIVSFVDAYYSGAFLGSVNNFFGRSGASEETRRMVSNELHVDQEHPPVFIWTTREDTIVPYRHSELFVDACRQARVPVTFKLYPHGPHGLGLAQSHPGELRTWTDTLLQWMAELSRQSV